jgi:GAF domain-containing protein
LLLPPLNLSSRFGSIPRRNIVHQQAFIAPFLEAVLSRSGADGAYVYRFDDNGRTAHLAAHSGIAPQVAHGFVQGPTAREHYERDAPLVLHKDAWADRRFAAFPEFATQPFEGVISVPLRHSDERAGVLNLCRLQPAAISAGDLAFLMGLGLPLGALLAAGAEVEKLERQLADRKLLDRAKGLLQATFAWTEEQAYLHLRRTSRQRRIAMREIALEVIEHRHLHVVEARHAS